MRFHTTPKDIVVSILVLLCCTAAIGWGIANLGMTNPSQVVADALMERLAGDGDLRIAIGRFGRSYLKTLTATDITITVGEQAVAHIDEVRIDGGLGRIALALVTAKSGLALSIEGFSVDASGDVSTLLATSDEPSSAMARVLRRLNAHIEVTDASVNLTLPEGRISLSEAAFSVHIAGGLSHLTLAGDGRSARIALGSTRGEFEDLRFGLDEEGRLGLEAGYGHIEDGEASIAARRIILAYLQDGNLSLSATDGALFLPGFSLYTPQIAARARIVDMQLADYTLSAAGFDAAYASYRLHAPTTTVSGLFDAPLARHSLAIASRSDELFTLTSPSVGTLGAHTLGALFTYDGGSAIRGEASLERVEWEGRSALDALTLSLNALDVKSGDLKASAAATLHVALPFELGSLDAPLWAELGYQSQEGAITATIGLREAETTQIAAPFDLSLSYQGRDGEAQLQAELLLAQQASLSALYNRGGGEEALLINGRLTELRSETFSAIVASRAQFLKPYVQDRTTLSGNISFFANQQDGERSGRLSTELALIDATIGKLDVDAGLTFSGSLAGEKLSVSSLTVATSGYRLAFSGETELNYWLPRGELALYRTDDGQLLAQATMVDHPPAGYEFSLRTAIEPLIAIDGMVAKRTANTIAGEATLSFEEERVPFTFELATDTLALTVQQQDRLDLYASLAPPQSVLIRGQSFTIPGDLASFSGTIEAFFTSLVDWSVQSSDFTLRRVRLRGNRFDLSAPFTASSTAISIPSFTIGDGRRSYAGSLSYRGHDLARLGAVGFLAPYTATLEVEDLIQVTLASGSDAIDVTARITDFPIGLLAGTGSAQDLSLSLVGSTDLKGAVSLDGVVEYGGEQSGFFSRFTVGDRFFELFDARYHNKELSITAGQARFDEGVLSLTASFDHTRHLSYIDQLSHLTVGATLSLGEVRSVFDLVRTNTSLLGHRLSAIVSIDDILLYGEGGIADGTYDVVWEEGRITAEGELLNFSYDTKNAHIFLQAKPEFGIGLTAYGSLGSSDFGVVLTDLYLPLAMLNRTFLKPVFLFHSGIGEGEIYLGGRADAIRPYGQLFINATEMFVFWLPDDLIQMKGVSVSIDGNRATTGRVPFFSTNTKTGKTVHGYGDLSAHLDGLSLLNYEIHADSLDHPVFIWIPMAGYEADIQGYVIGTFNLFGIGFQTWLDGDVTISDMTMTLGIKGLPDWYVPAFLTTTRFNVTTAKGVSFYYPNTPNPFIRATLTENQRFSFTYDHLADEFELDGVFAFRSGEIYYFQKNFFITEGSMVLHTDAISGRNAIIPRINLRAKVTDFDTLGNRIDIFLVLRDSTLTALNPHFESIPAKEVNEIMEILGQSILPTGAYGEIGLYSVASLAAAATDVAERLGLLEVSQTALLTEAIRISLGMDMFSIRSNIVQNILFDALPITGLMGSLSPIARYLHNTSIFMGKYIGTNFFLQALVHLTAMERTKVQTSFLSPDLSIDLELSLDWENPLATVSFFTQPHELSFTNILDTMGFSVTKRIVLR